MASCTFVFIYNIVIISTDDKIVVHISHMSPWRVDDEFVVNIYNAYLDFSIVAVLATTVSHGHW